MSVSSSLNQHVVHSFSPCLGSDASTTVAPELCKDSVGSVCELNSVVFAAQNNTSTDFPNETPVGLAKDGHIIVGPYNGDGELWSCDEHDICNGVFLSDNSYAYAMTYTFPYVVGCWGPGPDQAWSVESSCTTRSCSGGLNGISLGLSAMAAALMALVQL